MENAKIQFNYKLQDVSGLNSLSMNALICIKKAGNPAFNAIM